MKPPWITHAASWRKAAPHSSPFPRPPNPIRCAAPESTGERSEPSARTGRRSTPARRPDASRQYVPRRPSRRALLRYGRSLSAVYLSASPRFLDMPATPLDLLCINTVRTLAMDAVQKAKSGHPGTPMALAPLGYVAVHAGTCKHDPADPHWPNRDRFVLSCGHASMLLYCCLYLSGYDLTLEDLKQFRQWESRTPGHPEYGHTPGVETTTGPLGQGIGNAVGMAVAEAHLAATFNKRRARDRRSLHVLHLQRRRPDGRHLARGGVLRRPLQAREADRLLRRQPHHDRRHHRPHLHRRHGASASRPTAGRCCTSPT